MQQNTFIAELRESMYSGQDGKTPNVKNLMDSLKSNPKEMEAFIDELSQFDQTLPADRKFLNPVLNLDVGPKIQRLNNIAQ